MSKMMACLQLIIVAACIHYVSSGQCQPIFLKNGLIYQNCSGAGFTSLQELTLDDTAEVLDFSRNEFLDLPFIQESSKCDPDVNCRVVNNTKNHCRYDVSFSRNDIFTFHEHALHSLRCLRTLDLSYNQIRSSMLHPRTFQEGVYRLENLILRGNPLATLPDNVITSPFLRHIKLIDLSHCELETIGENSVDDHSELVTLDLSYNQLEEIKPSTFKGLKNLRFLYLQNNRLKVLPHQIFGDLDNLDILLLSSNNIQQFSRHSFYKDSKLKILDVSFNHLNQVPYESFQELSHLTHLILSYNPLLSVSNPDSRIVLGSVRTLEMEGMITLTHLGRRALASFPSLVTLSIRRSRNLKYIDPYFLGEGVSQLKKVHLDQNGLISLSEDALPWKQLNVLNLQGNPWVCDYRIRWMISSTAIQPKTVICDSPAQLKGRDIKSIDANMLQEPYPIVYTLIVILLALVIPFCGISVFCVWKKSGQCQCFSDIRGRYVSVYTRDTGGDGEDNVNIQVRINSARLRAVGNPNAEDMQSLIENENASPSGGDVLYEDEV